MSTNSDEYEKFIAEIVQDLGQNNRKITDLHYGRGNTIQGASGQEHQVDVSFIDHDFSRPALVLIECKRRQDKVHLEHVKVLFATVIDIAIKHHEKVGVRSILISTAGEQRGVRRFANHYGIALDITEHGPEYTFRYENLVQAVISDSGNLSVEMIPTVIRKCSSCGKTFEADDHQWVCSECEQGHRLDVIND